KQRHLAFDLGRLLTDDGLELRRQFGNGLMREDLLNRDRYAGAIRSRHQLNRKDRIATQTKEVVLHAGTFDLEHLLPNIAQRLLSLVARRDVSRRLLNV